MPSVQIANIGVENCAYSFDSLFSYLIPSELSGDVCEGVRVLVPFGKGNTIRQGFVFSVASVDEDAAGSFKSILSVLDPQPLLDREMVLLAEHIRERTFCTYFTAAKALLPGGMCMKTENVYRVAEHADQLPEIQDPDAQRLMTLIGAAGKPLRESLLLKQCGLASAAALTKLEKTGYVTKETLAFRLVNEITVRMVRLTESARAGVNEVKMTPKQRSVYSLLCDIETGSVKEICYYTGVTPGVVKTLEKNGICELYDLPVTRAKTDYEADAKELPPVLSEIQKKAFESLYAAYRRGKGETALLFGVTGSGKTNVYLSLIDKVLEDGKNAVVLVPEISLTPQTILLFEKRFGNAIAVLHSGLSIGERRDTFYRIKNEDVRVVIGTRSAVFAPLKNIGAIIVDEEQEHTYKSEMSPRYDARAVAKYRCVYHGALLVLASATPSVESYAKAIEGKYVLCEIGQRYGKAVLPDVITVDMTDKKNSNRYTAISEPLARALDENLKQKKQSILLVNRRGYNTFVACESCKTVVTCPKCSISLTYHAANNRLMCHYCGYSIPFTDTCPKCANKNIRYAGFGTQRVEQELKSRFPSASVLRMDADTTTAKNSHEKALSAFASGAYDILIGTQMVAKGLDFPNVTVVGIISADNELYNDDFRSAERTFDLITQVTGRAGRGSLPGKAYIQTVSPDNEILSVAARQDYKSFFRNEINMRRAMIYPPYCDICKVGFSADSESKAFYAANVFFQRIVTENNASGGVPLIILGPLAPKVAKINNLYRQKLIIKCKNNNAFRTLVGDTMKQVMQMKECKDVNIYAVMNPDNTDQ